jgi:hypothetical protein
VASAYDQQTKPSIRCQESRQAARGQVATSWLKLLCLCEAMASLSGPGILEVFLQDFRRTLSANFVQFVTLYMAAENHLHICTASPGNTAPQQPLRFLKLGLSSLDFQGCQTSAGLEGVIGYYYSLKSLTCTFTYILALRRKKKLTVLWCPTLQHFCQVEGCHHHDEHALIDVRCSVGVV